MKKLEGRAILCLLLSATLSLGMIYFFYLFVSQGDTWATFYANQHSFEDGVLKVGRVYDRNQKLLLKNDEEGSHYAKDESLRKATYHAVGDPYGNISTGANQAFRSRLIGYRLLTGTSGLWNKSGGKVLLTIDSSLNKTAYEALQGKDGFVGVYNWKTGEIFAMVSKPTLDPENYPQNIIDGVYLNKLLSATFPPGSTFKLVTTVAAIENIENLEEWTFSCDGCHEIDGEKITCPKVHGKVDIYGALAKSCNGAFAELTLQLGSDIMQQYAKDLGFEDSYNVNGIKTSNGSFNFYSSDVNLAWSGIGQAEDQVNPLSMMVFLGAIAGEGEAAKPVLLQDNSLQEKIKEVVKGKNSVARNGKVKLLSVETAKILRQMMANNVKETYGVGNYPGIDLHAKSGTAEIENKKPHSWFVGFTGDYAFVVCSENSGSGASVAGPIANKVLQSMKAAGYFENK